MKETKFKQTEVGMIPSDWEVKKLGDIAQYRRGSFPQPYGLPKWYDGKGAMPFVQVADVSTDSFCLNSETKQQISTLAQPMSVFVPKNSVLVTLQGSIGKVAITQYDSYVDRTLAIFKAYNLPMSSIYFSYQLSKKFAIEREKAPGGIIKTITKEAFSDFCLPLPPTIEEQQRISNALSDVDTLIANLEKLIAKKKNIKQGAMQQLLTGKKRLPGFGGKWNKKVISKLGYTYNGLNGKNASDFGKGSAQYITFLNVLNNPVVDKHLFQKVNVSEAENQNKVLKDDLLFNTSSEVPEEVGICSVLKAEVPNLYLNSFCFGFRLTDTAVDGLFLSYYFRSPLGRSLMSLLAQGSTRYNLSKDNFLKSSIVIPSSKTEQTAIANVLSDMDTEIATLEIKLAKYRKLKTGMMQQLLTGKIRLV